MLVDILRGLVMGVFHWPPGRKLRFLVLSLTCLLLFCAFQRIRNPDIGLSPSDAQLSFPLAWKHIHCSSRQGGAWFIPREWSVGQAEPKTIVEAAQLAFRAANSSIDRGIPHSSIPLIVHQTWKNSRVDTWSPQQGRSAERWLAISAGDSKMAYFFWDDEGVMQLLKQHRPEFVNYFEALPFPVEKSDAFRILVLEYVGGIYADIDTEPLRVPDTWIRPADLEPWTDPVSAITYGPIRHGTSMLQQPEFRPVQLLLGIEADCDPDSDSFWRMGYSYPIQLTQWCLASAPNHPVLSLFIETLSARLKKVADHHGGSLTDLEIDAELRRIDPVGLTGPAAVTEATKTWLAQQVGFRWNALTGLHDGGKSKLVQDVMVLPITAFSPGRGHYGNMGSKPTTHPDARVKHHAQNSWRKFNVIVEVGKFCRTFFGSCRNWPKVP